MNYQPPLLLVKPLWHCYIHSYILLVQSGDLHNYSVRYSFVSLSDNALQISDQAKACKGNLCQ